MLSFGKKKPALLGIDISTTAIKLIQLTRNHAGAVPYHVEHYAIEPLPANAVVEKKIADIEAVGQCIERALIRSATKTKRAAVAVSGSAVITKPIAMSASLSDNEMETQILLEADQYIPYPLEEVNIDFDVLGPSNSSPELVDVLLAATRSENVDDRVAALEVAGLTAAVVDVESFAMERACELLGDAAENERIEQTIAVADIGATTTTLHVLHDGKIQYTREQNFGGQQLTDDVQRRYGLSRDQAIEQITSHSLPENYETEVLAPFKEALVQQIGRALQFFYSSSNYNRTDQIIIAGGAANIAKLDELIEERLGLPTTVANPFSQMSIASSIKPQALNHDAPTLMVAVGLALRGFD